MKQLKLVELVWRRHSGGGGEGGIRQRRWGPEVRGPPPDGHRAPTKQGSTLWRRAQNCARGARAVPIGSTPERRPHAVAAAVRRGGAVVRCTGAECESAVPSPNRQRQARTDQQSARHTTNPIRDSARESRRDNDGPTRHDVRHTMLGVGEDRSQSQKITNAVYEYVHFITERLTPESESDDVTGRNGPVNVRGLPSPHLLRGLPSPPTWVRPTSA